MKHLMFAVAALGLAAACNPNAQTNNPPIATDQTAPQQQAQAPAAGASSFTEDQARTRLSDMGYTNVSGLTKDADGAWSGQATKDGKTSTVKVDYQGNVTPKQ